MVSTELVPCVELLEGVSWATVVATAGAFAEPAPNSVGAAKTESKSLPAASQARPRPGQRSVVVTEAEARLTKLLEQKGRQSSYVARVCENGKNWRR